MNRILLAIMFALGLLTSAHAGECNQFSPQVLDIAKSKIAEIQAEMNSTFRPTMPSKTVKKYLEDFLYGIEIKLYGPQIRSKQPYPRQEMEKLWKFVSTSEFSAIEECFPGFSAIIFQARQRNVSLKAAQLFDVYRSWIYISACNEIRSGYLVVFVNDIELQRARAAVKAIEKKLQSEDQNLDMTEIWNEAGKPIRMSIGQAQCQRTLANLLYSNPNGAFQVLRPKD
jgi:hypothetical protein